VPGRDKKSDPTDCEWIQRLHSCGLLRGSFRPEEAVCMLRTLVRDKANLVAESGVSCKVTQFVRAANTHRLRGGSIRQECGLGPHIELKTSGSPGLVTKVSSRSVWSSTCDKSHDLMSVGILRLQDRARERAKSVPCENRMVSHSLNY
jgi:hypothetical protein